eukprot:TRINITY_DN1033_c2_g1_i18.p1 TRINITY_DN1033_c2_g1~~TRINITY_DN1033_c2_g1_i18.p1  ORF type:complete len:647 (-),score=117.33 TRINITY_DN1033_c2_g1_i18:162-2102(-)
MESSDTSSPVISLSQGSRACDEESLDDETFSSMEIPIEKIFASFSHVKSFLSDTFKCFSIHVRARDTKYPHGLSKDMFCEDNVVGKKYECCEKGCSWFAWFRKKETGVIVLGRCFNFKHSHSLVRTKEMCMKSMKDLTSEEKICIEKLRQARAKPSTSKTFMELFFNTTYDEWLIRNIMRKDRRYEISNDPERFMERIAEDSMDRKCVYSIHVDEEGTWDMIFIGLNKGLDDFIHNGSFFSIDATSGTNRYGLLLVTIVCQDFLGKIKAIAYAFVPRESADCYAWVMKTLKTFFSGLQPVLVASDNHPSISAAISSIFPTTHHRDAFDKLVMENDASGMSYLKQLRIWLPKWCDAFLPCTFLGRRNTTSINESQHARLKRTLNAASTLVDCLDAIWSCKDSEDVSLPKLRPLTWDLGHGRSISPLAAHILDKEIQAALRSCRAKMINEKRWIVNESVLGGHDFVVEAIDEKTYNCTCCHPIRTRLPCRHVVAVLAQQQLLSNIINVCHPYWFGSHSEKCNGAMPMQKHEHWHKTQDIEEFADAIEMESEVTYGDLKSFLNQLFTYRKCPGFEHSFLRVKDVCLQEIKSLKEAAREKKGESKRRERDTGPPPDISFTGEPIRKRTKSAMEKALYKKARDVSIGNEYE